MRPMDVMIDVGTKLGRASSNRLALINCTMIDDRFPPMTSPRQAIVRGIGKATRFFKANRLPDIRSRESEVKGERTGPYCVYKRPFPLNQKDKVTKELMRIIKSKALIDFSSLVLFIKP